jgi:radical SAM-linked protein
MQRIRIQFSWGEELKFLSHLDLMRLLERSVRRANLPIGFSDGFNPHMKISMGIPLSVGMTSQGEFTDLFFEQWININHLKNKLNEVMPEGIKVLEVKLIHPQAPSLTSIINAAVYSVEIYCNSPAFDFRTISLAKEEFFKKNEIIIERETKHGKKIINIRPMIFWLKTNTEEQKNSTQPNESKFLEMCLQVGEKGTAKPDEVIKTLELPLSIKSICREFLFIKKGGAFVSPMDN